MTRQATIEEIRKFHKEQGRKVRISQDGQVKYCDEGCKFWLDGRFVEEYKVDPINGVVCP